MGLQSKLFIALLMTAVLAVAATSTAARFAFLSGFLGYINDQETSRARGVLRSLAWHYRKHGNWGFFRVDPHAWFDMVGQVSGMPDLGMRLALLDSNRRFVIGNPVLGNGLALEPIELDGKVVGWLVVLPLNKLTAGAAGSFQRQQLVSTWLIGGVAVGLAALVAVVLARRILEPIRGVGAATQRLAAGNYAVRLDVSSADEIGRLATDFNRLALVLERNEVMRRTFMADVSHELRTPIAILRAELEAIEDELHTLTPASLKSLQGEVAMLGKLIDDLYDLSLADVGGLTYRMSRLDLGEFLRERLLACQDRYKERCIGIDASLPDCALTIAADPMRLHQLFNNLLENSLRYTESGGRLCIACRAEYEGAVIDWQDTAPGVPDELLPRLFERFYRVDPSRNRASGGAGLGLAIAKSIVEAHAGTILARQSPLGGLWIRVTLPITG